MISQSLTLLGATLVLTSLAFACSSRPAEGVDDSSQDLVNDAATIAAVDPFDPASCRGPQLTAASVTPMLAPGSNKTAQMGHVSVAVRSHHCVIQPTETDPHHVSCSAWIAQAPDPSTGAFGSLSASSYASLVPKQEPVKASGGWVQLSSNAVNGLWAVAWLGFETTADPVTEPQFIPCQSKNGAAFECNIAGLELWPSSTGPTDAQVHYRGSAGDITVTPSCVRIVFGASNYSEYYTAWDESQAVFLGHW